MMLMWYAAKFVSQNIGPAACGRGFFFLISFIVLNE